jgi:hypothetical protein
VIATNLDDSGELVSELIETEENKAKLRVSCRADIKIFLVHNLNPRNNNTKALRSSCVHVIDSDIRVEVKSETDSEKN